MATSTTVEPRTHQPGAAAVRSPITAMRFVLAVLAVLVAFVPLLGSDGDASPFREQFRAILAELPKWLLDLVVGALQLATFAAPIGTLVTLLVTRRLRRLLAVVLSVVIAIAILALVAAIVGTRVLHLGRHGASAYGPGAAFPTTAGLSALCASVFVESPWQMARWRRLGRVVLICAVVARLGSALAEPSTIAMAVATGAVASALTHLLLGVPNHRPTASDVGLVLSRFGFGLRELSVVTEPNYRGVATFNATTNDGMPLFIKVLSRESGAALLPVRLYRAVRFRDVGDDRPFRSLRSRVEHEALCALKAHADGVPTPRVVVVADFPNDGMLLAFETAPLRSIASLAPDEQSSALLQRAWQSVAALRRSNTAHRRLNADYVCIDSNANVILVDFSSAHLGAGERSMAGDLAEVLAATAARLGVTQAVAAAIDAIGPDAVATALPRLQPLALTRATRSLVKDAGCLEDLKDEIQRTTGAAAASADELERIKPRTLIGLLMAAAGLWALLPQLLNAGNILDQTRSARWQWTVAAVGFSALTYLGAAIALDGSLPERLSLGPNIGLQVATSFVGVAAPGGALAITARFLQRRGIDPALAVAAVGVNSVAGVLVHVGLIGVFAAWAGTSGIDAFVLPSFGSIAFAVLMVVVVAASSLLWPRWRRFVARTMFPPLRRAAHGIASTARHPSNLAELFGGSATVTLGYLFALEASALAFGHAPPFTSVALVYLIGSVVSSVAPTPGGIGAVEATLIAGLRSARMPSDAALGAVMLFRVATFWLPLFPGWLAFRSLQRSGSL